MAEVNVKTTKHYLTMQAVSTALTPLQKLPHPPWSSQSLGRPDPPWLLTHSKLHPGLHCPALA